MIDTNNIYIGMRVVGASGAPTKFEHIAGTIIDTDCGGRGFAALVEFDEYIDGHDGLGWGEASGKMGHCYWVLDKEIDELPTANVPDSYDIEYDNLFG